MHCPDCFNKSKLCKINYRNKKIIIFLKKKKISLQDEHVLDMVGLQTINFKNSHELSS